MKRAIEYVTPVFVMALALTATPAMSAEVVTLTQTGCQFLEPEGTDRKFKTSKAEDCNKINAESGKQRVADSKTIKLKPGEYVFSCPLNPTPDYRVVVAEP